MTSTDLDALFRPWEDPAEDDINMAVMDGNMARCKCGHTFFVSMPSVCKCGEVKEYWRVNSSGLVKLSRMDLGHLSNTVRLLAERLEQGPDQEDRARVEVALDLFYREIASRDKEIKQITGIMAALKRSLDVS